MNSVEIIPVVSLFHHCTKFFSVKFGLLHSSNPEMRLHIERFLWLENGKERKNQGYCNLYNFLNFSSSPSPNRHCSNFLYCKTDETLPFILENGIPFYIGQSSLQTNLFPDDKQTQKTRETVGIKYVENLQNTLKGLDIKLLLSGSGFQKYFGHCYFIETLDFSTLKVEQYSSLNHK